MLQKFILLGVLFLLGMNTTTAQIAYENTYSGLIDQKYPVLVWVQIKNNGTVTGNYSYKNKGLPLLLKGTYTKGVFSLTETNEKNAVTGTFLIQENAEKLLGSWTSADKKRVLPVEMTKINTEQVVMDSEEIIYNTKGARSETEVLECNYNISLPILKATKNPSVLANYTPEKLFNMGDQVDANYKTIKNKTATCDEFPIDYDYSCSASQIGDLLNIMGGGYIFAGGAHGSAFAFSEVVNLKNGKKIIAADCFDPIKYKELGKLLDGFLVKEMESSNYEKDCLTEDLPSGQKYQAVKAGNFGSPTEYSFILVSSGVNFIRNFDMPHVAQVCDAVSFVVPFKDLAPFIKKDGVLVPFCN